MAFYSPTFAFACFPYLICRPNFPKMKVVCMAPEPDKGIQRHPLDVPLEWERPRPSSRPDVFPQFTPMKMPMPLPLPFDPPEDEEDEEEEEHREDEEEEKREEEVQENPDD